MLKVYLTVDTEIWLPGWDPASFAGNFQRFFYGRTPRGDFGVPYQLDLLNQYGLRAVFLVEPLFACVFGLDPLREMVSLIQQRGQDVQLHLHTEWLRLMDRSLVGGSTGEHLRYFNEDQQTALIAQGLSNLRAAGAEGVCAFRAGNYGADRATLRALARNNLRYDTSYNWCYLGAACGLNTEQPLLQPRLMEGVIEVPIAFFEDYPGHYRHLQLEACALAEIKHALLQAYARGWSTFVIVSHSFELLDRGRADGILIRRFRRLCHFLAAHRDKFTTATFDGELATSAPVPATMLKGRLSQTAWRWGEQLARRTPLRTLTVPWSRPVDRR